MEFVWFALIGLVAGWLAGKLVKGGGSGLVGNLIVGVLGAVLGGFLFRQFGISTADGLLGAILVATAGSVVLLILLRFVKTS